jgi:hypothetical protein
MSVPSAVLRSRFQLPIVKVRPGSIVAGVLGEVGPLWFGVHWVGGRQFLCCGSEEAGCPLCSLGQSRVVGVTMMEIRLQGGRQEFLLELSPLAFSNFESRLRFAGFDLKCGVQVQVTRARARGGLRIEPCGPCDRFEMWLDGERRLLNAWAVLYGLPLSESGESFTQFLERTRSVIEARGRLLLGSHRG